MRFATGAVLIPHGIQEIMLGSAVKFAPYIEKQMGAPYPMIWPIRQSSRNPLQRFALPSDFSPAWRH